MIALLLLAKKALNMKVFQSPGRHISALFSPILVLPAASVLFAVLQLLSQASLEAGAGVCPALFQLLQLLACNGIFSPVCAVFFGSRNIPGLSRIQPGFQFLLGFQYNRTSP